MSDVSTALESKAGLANSFRSASLVLHADDFGMSPAVNDGIVAAFTSGLLTSTSVLANAPAAKQAFVAWRKLDSLRASGQLPSLAPRSELHDAGGPFDLGIHLNLTQGRPLTGAFYPAPLLDREGRFPGVFPLLAGLTAGGSRYRQAIRRELARQIEFVLDEGLPLTHLNGHQYVEMFPVISDIIPELLTHYSIPVVRVARERGLAMTTLLHSFRPVQWGLAQIKRWFASSFVRKIDRFTKQHPRDYFGTAHAGTIDLRTMQCFVSRLRRGLAEIGMHPAREDDNALSRRDDGWADPLASVRPRELELLCSRELVEILSRRGIALARLSDLAATRAVRRAA